MEDARTLVVLTFLINQLIAAGLISEPSAREIKRQVIIKNTGTDNEHCQINEEG